MIDQVAAQFEVCFSISLLEDIKQGSYQEVPDFASRYILNIKKFKQDGNV